MKGKSLSILAFGVLFIAGLFPIVDAKADDTTCMFRAEMEDAHLYVQDEDEEGNDQDKVFEGWVKAGHRVKIKSQTGWITYNYKLRSGDRTHGDNRARCKGGNTIRVP